MKRLLLVFLFSSISLSYAGLDSWLRSAIQSAKSLVNYIGDDIELEFGWLAAKEPTKYKKFKQQSDSLQKEINTYLSKYEKDDNYASFQQAEQKLEQLFQTHDVLLADAQKTLKPADFEKFQKTIEIRQKHLKTTFEKLSIKGALETIWKKFSTASAREQLNNNNPHANETVTVAQNNTLPQQEIEFREKRQPYIKTGLEKFLGRSLENKTMPTLGFVGTGGGYRALILTIGYLVGAEQMGLLGACSYMTSLSGSTWFLGPWMFFGGTMTSMKAYVQSLIRNKYFDLADVIKKMDKSRFIDDVIWPKFIFGQPIASVDIFGGLLAEGLLSRAGDQRQKQRLSEQWNRIKDGAYPFPIYTSISMHQIEKVYRYNWYEFNPLELRNLELNLVIPSYAINWEFDRAKSTMTAPEQSFGFFMGIFGSAYAVNIKDIIRLMFSETKKEEQKQTSEFERIKFKITQKILSGLGDVPKIGTLRIAPGRINNPFHYMIGAYTLGRDLWLLHRDYLTFVDAGIDYNIPVRPLCRPERQVKAIIIGESSGNVEAAADLDKLFADIERVYHYHYTRVDDNATITLRLYKDKDHEQAPVIVYVNFLKDPNLLARAQNNPELKKLIDTYQLQTFDPVRCIKESFCNTFNFNYSEKEFLQLCAMAELNMRMNHVAIKEFLRRELKL